MLRIPNVVFDRYVAHLGNKRVPLTRFDECRKWSRYFLDFCDKYSVPADKVEKVRLFCKTEGFFGRSGEVFIWLTDD